MASPSPSREFLRSQFGSVFQILPEGHDKPLKQAFYSTAATLFVILACCAAFAVYHILLPFIRPLLWALLCGVVLFPLKYRLVTTSRHWLGGLRKSGTPLIVGTILLPVNMADSAVTKAAVILQQYIVPVAIIALLLPAVYFLVYIWLGQAFLDAILTIFSFVDNVVGYFCALWVWSFVCAYIVILLVFWSPDRRAMFKLLSIPVWTALLFHMVTIFGPFRVPVIFALLTLMTVSVVVGLSEAGAAFAADVDGSGGQSVSLADWVQNKLNSVIRCFRVNTPLQDHHGDPESVADGSNVGDGEERSEHGESGTERVSATKDVHQSLPRGKQPSCASQRRSGHQQQQKSVGDYCLIWLFWSLVIVHLWTYKFFFLILPLPIVCILVKKLGGYVGLWAWLRVSLLSGWTKLGDRVMSDPRFDVILPLPVRRVLQWIFTLDSKVALSLYNGMDSIISILIICLLIVIAALVPVFAVLEIHRESMHLVHLTSNLMNKSMHPELAQWLPAQEAVESTLESVVDNAYVYGRDFISQQLRGMLSGDDTSKEQVERQVLHVWDKMYKTWFAKNESSVVDNSLQRQLSIDLSDVSSPTDLIAKLQLFNIDLVEFARENVGLFLTVLESVWSVLVNNMALLVNVIISIISLLFGSGTAILNTVLEVVVFLTALFYLLSTSSHSYKPVDLFTSLSPASDDLAIGDAFGEAIGSVFIASFKMSVFYGLYTWMTHLLFGVQIVFIPSVLAAVLAAMPFLGTYFAAIPAIIDLWLVNGRKLEAAAIFLAHYLPTLFVDAAMYREIKGGHPYMTALAVAGGIYWLGLEGALIGPVLLCCLIVAVKMYQTFLKPDSTLSSHSSTADEKRIKLAQLKSASIAN